MALHDLSWEDEILPTEWLGLKSRLDRQTWRYIAISLGTHLAFLALIMTMPEDSRTLDLDASFQNDRFVQMMFEPPRETVEPPQQDGPGEVAEASSKHAGEEGKAGSEDTSELNKRLAIKGDREPEDLQLRRLRDIEVAQNAGVAGVMNDQVASWFGNAETSVGSDALHALGNLDGVDQGKAMGNIGALGIRDAGRGGGGIKERSIGLADLANDGMKRGRRAGRGTQDMGDRDAKVPGEVIARPPILDGGLDREIVQRVVRQHRGELKACYENELQKNKSLQGELVIKFTISGKGEVIAAVKQSSDIKSASLEACVTQRIRRWVFPEPRGGGIVVVKYPFRFSSGT
jgi:hypothetical protein